MEILSQSSAIAAFPEIVKFQGRDHVGWQRNLHWEAALAVDWVVTSTFVFCFGFQARPTQYKILGFPEGSVLVSGFPQSD